MQVALLDPAVAPRTSQAIVPAARRTAEVQQHPLYYNPGPAPLPLHAAQQTGDVQVARLWGDIMDRRWHEQGLTVTFSAVGQRYK